MRNTRLIGFDIYTIPPSSLIDRESWQSAPAWRGIAHVAHPLLVAGAARRPVRWPAAAATPTPEKPPRPVLVAQPGGGAEAALTAYRRRSPRPRGKPAVVPRRRQAGPAQGRCRRPGASAATLLAVLDPGDLPPAGAVRAQAQLAAAEADLGRARADQARYATLAERPAGQPLRARRAERRTARRRRRRSRAARAQLDVARNQAGYSQLRAPRDGVIATRQAEAGQVVAAGQTVFTLAADGEREVAIALPEQPHRAISPSASRCWSSCGARRASACRARIREIAPAADPQARTYAARVDLRRRREGGRTRPERARVRAGRTATARRCSVPLSALQRGANGATARVGGRSEDRASCTCAGAARRATARTACRCCRASTPDDWVVAAGGHLLREGQMVDAGRSRQPPGRADRADASPHPAADAH